MTLQDLMRAIDALSSEELHRLRLYIDERQQQANPLRELTPEERIRRLNAAAAALREGLTPDQLAEMTAAMNEEYIEPFDEDVWKD